MDAPGHDDERPAEVGRQRLQRLCTAERQRHRKEGLQNRATELPVDDMRAIAFHYQSPAAAFTTLLQNSTALSGNEFSGAIALFLGIPDPNIVEAKARMGNPSFFQDRGSIRREFDPYGNSLSNYMGKDHMRVQYHNDIQNEIRFLATSVGMNLRATPLDLFVRDIMPQNQRRYSMEIRQRRNFHGGLVPDLFNPETGTMYDVKTTGFNRPDYFSRQSAVDNKAATIPGEYVRKAAAVDASFNETSARLRPGPVESRLASMKQVVCISVGAFGEVNRATSDLLSQIAEKGSRRPERFGCCHGPTQAKGIIAQWAMRRLGRLCLRGAVRVRHGALETVAQRTNPNQPPPRMDGQTEAPLNEWDSGNRVWVPAA
jgi:hypothetical protein